MKNSSKKQTEVKPAQLKSGYIWGEQPLKCDEIQAVLLAYMTHDLGETQSILVREHIRKCDSCRAEAAEIEETFSLLRQTGGTSDHLHLSDERRKRILLAVFHPAINWIDLHHKLVSVVLAVVILTTTILALRNFAIFRNEPLEEGIPIWRYFKSGELPEMVEKRLKEAAGESGSEISGQKTEVRNTNEGIQK